MVNLYQDQLPEQVRTLLADFDATLAKLLEYRTFPKNRAPYAEEQRARLRQLQQGSIPEYYFKRDQRELSGLRIKASGETGRFAHGYAPYAVETTQEVEEFWRQALATEARILEAHLESKTNFPKGGLVIGEEMVRRLREAALAADSWGIKVEAPAPRGRTR